MHKVIVFKNEIELCYQIYQTEENIIELQIFGHYFAKRVKLTFILAFCGGAIYRFRVLINL